MQRLSPLLLLALGVFAGPSAAQAAPAPAHPVVAGFERYFGGDGADLARGGRLLFGELGCVKCHKAEGVGAKQPPVLDEVGGRVRPTYVEKFLADPQAVKPGTTMPNVLGADPDRARKARALAHFLASTGTLRHQHIPPKSIAAGHALYARVGCVACHGSRDARGEADRRVASSVPLGDPKAKYTLPSLAAFLEDPLHSRTSGRMPRLLDRKEAADVAGYLLQGLKGSVGGKGSTKYAYYTGGFDALPDFARLKPAATGTASGFSLEVARADSNYALTFEGVFAAPRDGNFTFTLTSDDGSRLYIDGKQVVDNDGIHPAQTKLGSARLTRGVHKVTVAFFQGGGGAELEVLIQGPGLSPRPLGDMVAPSEEQLKKKPSPRPGEEAFEVVPALAAEGRKLFASLGCAACHQLKGSAGPIASTLTAPAFDRLAADRGCLAERPAGPAVRYDLSKRQRQAIAAALRAKAPAATAATRVADTLLAQNCYACHLRDKVGGPPEELNKLFLTTMPEMGDEGRLPPPLDGAGAKLRPDYLRTLLDRGVHDRPYMHTRMPGFGAAVGHLVEDLPRLDRLPAVPLVRFKEPASRVKSQARHLVGSGAFGCIKCHTFAGKKAEGVQGIDMTIMTKRLRRDWFHAYVANPQVIRPGTRMPSGFTDGKSALPDTLGGSAELQIEAMWQYLLDGTSAREPAGLNQGAIVLEPTRGAILYRNFITGAGTRAIAVGYPEKAHLAFDANEMRLALIWQGPFMDAHRHWTGRGEGFEGPLGDNVVALHRGAAFAVLKDPDAAWPTAAPKALGYRFKGYRLTRDDRPTFLYAMNGVRVEDFCNPVVAGKEVRLRRTLRLASEGPVERLAFRAAVGDKVEPLPNGWFQVDGGMKLKFAAGRPRVRRAGGKSELIVPVPFSAGKAALEYDVAW